MRVRLSDIAYARSGDKGSGANIGVIARTSIAYDVLRERLTAEVVRAFFEPLGTTDVQRYELPNLSALNFVLANVLEHGASLSLRIDAQGKGLAQALLEMEIDVPEDRLAQMRVKEQR